MTKLPATGRASRLARRSASKLAGLLYALQKAPIGTIIEFVLPAGVMVIPAMQSFGIIPGGPRWFVGLLIVYGAEQAFTRYRRGSVSRIYAERIQQANGAFASTVESIVVRLINSPRGFTDDQSHDVCVSLLARIREFAEIALGYDESGHIRATLAVPTMVDRSGTQVEALRIWCYDRPANPAYTVLELGQKLPGAPLAFETGKADIIEDVHTLAMVPDATQRPYRSVLSIPIPVGRRLPKTGRPLAVVNLDVDKPAVFTPDIAINRLMPYIGPVINQIGVVLISRRSGTPYGFTR